MPEDTSWDRHLSAAADGEGLIGHAGAMLLRKLADQCGLTSALGAALARASKFPLFVRGWRWYRWQSCSLRPDNAGSMRHEVAQVEWIR